MQEADSNFGDGPAASAYQVAWTEAHERRLFSLQVAELFRFGPFSAAASFVGAIITFVVLIDGNDGGPGLYWFSLFTCLTIFRVATIVGYDRAAGANPAMWARLAFAANLVAGCLWGLLGSVLFPESSGHRELFTVLVIAGFVGGSVTSYAAVKYMHAALAVPAMLPTVIYLAIMRDGLYVYSAVLAAVFLIAVVGVANKLHTHIAERLKLSIENRELLEKLGSALELAGRENRNLEHRAAIREKNARQAMERANVLSAQVQNLPFPLIECDTHLHLLAGNDAAQRLLGHALEATRGGDFLAWLCGAEAAREPTRQILEATAGRSAATVAVSFQDARGKLQRATLSTMPHFPDDGSPGRIAVLLTDIAPAGA